MKNNFKIPIIILLVISIVIVFKIIDNYKTKNVFSNSKKELIVNNLKECLYYGFDKFKIKNIDLKNKCSAFDTSCNESFNEIKKINIEIYEICKGAAK